MVRQPLKTKSIPKTPKRQNEPTAANKTLLENKQEYLTHICDLVTDLIIKHFISMYEDVLKHNYGKSRSQDTQILKFFQERLEEVPKWNTQLIENEYQQFLKIKGCTYFGDLIKAILITYTHLALIKPNGSLKEVKMKLTIPNPENFLHRIYINVARFLWSNPELLFHERSTIARQKDLNKIVTYVDKAVRASVRESLPYDLLLKEVIENSTTKPVNMNDKNDKREQKKQ